MRKLKTMINQCCQLLVGGWDDNNLEAKLQLPLLFGSLTPTLSAQNTCFTLLLSVDCDQMSGVFNFLLGLGRLSAPSAADIIKHQVSDFDSRAPFMPAMWSFTSIWKFSGMREYTLMVSIFRVRSVHSQGHFLLPCTKP